MCKGNGGFRRRSGGFPNVDENLRRKDEEARRNMSEELAVPFRPGCDITAC